MKKTKIVALTMVAAIALVGAGYAAWGTVITDNTTLNTGHWEVVLENDALGDSLVAGDEVYEFTNVGGTITEDSSPLSNDGYGHYDETDASKLARAKQVDGSNFVYTIAPTIDSDKDTVNFSFYNMHPGTVAKTKFEIRNYSSIPAKVTNVDVKLDDGTLDTKQQQLADAIEVSGSLYNHVGSGSSTLIGTIPSGTTLSNLSSVLEGLLHDKELVPQGSIDFNNRDGSELEVSGLNFKLPAAALSGNTGMDASLPIAITFDFSQYNQN